MKILVTGGGGFLGSSICRQLQQLGHEVIAFQRSPSPELSDSGIEVIQGDICSLRELKSAANGCQAIIHTAGKAGIWGSLAEYERINVGGTTNVIETCRSSRIPILVHTSSPSVVHASGDIEGGDESLPLAEHFQAPYPATKAEAEKRVLAANSADLKTTALRPHLIWGPNDPHILPRLAAKVRRGKLALPGAEKKIDTVYVDNAARAHVNALADLAGEARSAGKAYFITNDEPLPQGEIISRLLAAMGVQAEIRPVPAGLARAAGAICETTWRLLGLKSEPPITRFSATQLSTAHWFDISAAKRDLSYRIDFSIEEGLAALRKSFT